MKNLLLTLHHRLSLLHCVIVMHCFKYQKIQNVERIQLPVVVDVYLYKPHCIKTNTPFTNYFECTCTYRAVIKTTTIQNCMYTSLQESLPPPWCKTGFSKRCFILPVLKELLLRITPWTCKCARRKKPEALDKKAPE